MFIYNNENPKNNKLIMHESSNRTVFYSFFLLTNIQDVADTQETNTRSTSDCQKTTGET